MSARDVDLEFEKAYQRLFSTSAAPSSGAGRSSSASSEPRAESSQAPHTVDHGLQSLSRTASASRVEKAKQPHGLSALQSVPRKSKAQERPAQVQRERHSLPRSLQSPLDALARHASNSKGKARASTGQLEAEERPAKKAQRSSTATPAPAVPHSGSVPYPGSVAYYPYPTGQPSYQVSAPLIASGSNMTSMPAQAVAWTQPIMSAGPMPAIGYPGFSASVTFSQPQFFASPPQAVPSAVAAPSPDAWSQQYAASATSYEPQQQQQQQQQHRFDTTPSESRTRPHASSSSLSAADENAIARRKWNLEQAALFDSKEHLRRTFREASVFDLQKLKAKQKQQKQQKEAKKQKEPKQPKKQKPQKPQKQQQQQQEPWTPDLADNEPRAPKKRGRPARVRDDDPPQGGIPLVNATDATIRVKTEEGAETLPLNAAAPRSAFDGSLPLASDRGRPYDRESHTLFVHPQLRLRWLARLAIVRAEQQANGGGQASPSAADTSQWARWSNSVYARLPGLGNSASPPRDEASSTQQTHSQSDPAGLFPRDKRHAYIALRKTQHSAKRTASTRICVRRLLRYLAKTAAAVDALGPHIEKPAVLRDKHRAAKLAKHMLTTARPTALDVRRMWSVWARGAHARSVDKAGGPPRQQRRVSFAAPFRVAEGESVAQVKMEPPSPSTTRTWLTSPRTAKVKQEPDSDGIMTPLVPASPALGGASTPLEAGAAQSAAAVRVCAPLFLRRNFRVYRLLGLAHLPLS
ncbi:conserved hypothetical protein [Sporisorium reilianum SRZ2]|uniref:Uncharacterized protein n=1 Tax=Sporisorium reilianum (strain SRZ2) TaxID=999809 RepID=E6ZKZ9_SPORE|nr:conserved hypothetical protein [Sporisorium reilianum SRZ2]